jgi:hypothetical protein
LFRFICEFSIFRLSVVCVSRCRVLPVRKFATMSSRSLCSLLHKTNRSLVILNRNLFTLSRTSTRRPSPERWQKQRGALVSQSVCYSQALGSLTKDQAHDLVFRLNEEERSILAEQLEKFILKEDKQKLECKSVPRCSFNVPSSIIPATR